MSGEKPATRESVVPRDLSGILKDAPLGAWVALSHDKTRIVATGDSISCDYHLGALPWRRRSGSV